MTKAQNTRVISTPNSELTAAHKAVTAESISASITLAIGNVVAAFTELEERVRADNGKLYPINVELPPEVSSDGALETVNRFAYIAKSVAGSLCWKLETMIDQSDERIDQQKRKIRDAVRALNSGRTDERMVERMADFLETLVEQRAILVAGFGAAVDAYEAEIGEQFETKGMRLDRQRAIETSAKPAFSERLKALGV